MNGSIRADELESLLRDIATLHRRLLVTLETQRAALRRADGAAVARAAEEHEALLGEERRLDQRRRALVARHAPAGRDPSRVTLTELAELVSEPERAALRALADEARGCVARARAESAALGQATRSLLSHMQGVMRQVGQSLSHARTYTRKGFVEQGASVVTAVDLAC